MVFESVRGYVEIASGLSELTRARALEAAHGLLALPAAGIATGSKVAGQAGTLADELMAAATANRANLTALVRSEVDVAVTRLGLVPAQKLHEAQAESARLRAEVARLRSAPLKAAAVEGAVKKAAAPKAPVKKVAAPKAQVKKAAVLKSAGRKSAAAKPSVRKAAAPKPASAKAAAVKPTVRKAAAPKGAARKSAVTTRAKPAGT